MKKIKKTILFLTYYIQKMRNVKRTSPSKKIKTHVFPYKALDPIIQVLPSGYIVVKPYEGADEMRANVGDFPSDIVDRLREIQESLAAREKINSSELEALLRNFSPERIISRESRLESMIDKFVSELPVLKQELRDAVNGGIELTTSRMEELIKDSLREFVQAQMSQIKEVSTMPMQELSEKIENLRSIVNSFEVGPELNSRFMELKTRLEGSISLMVTSQIESLKSELINGEFAKVGSRIDRLEELIRSMNVSDVTREMVSKLEGLMNENIGLQDEMRTRIQDVYETLNTTRLTQPVLERLSLMEMSTRKSLDTLFEDIRREIGENKGRGYEDLKRIIENRMTMEVAKPLLEKLDSMKPTQDKILEEQILIKGLVRDILSLNISENLSSKLDTVERGLRNSQTENLDLIRQLITSSVNPIESRLQSLETSLKTMNMEDVKSQLESVNDTLKIISKQELNTEVLKRLASIEIQLMNLPRETSEAPVMDMGFVVDLKDRMDLLRTLVEEFKSGSKDDINMIRSMIYELELKTDFAPVLSEVQLLKSDFMAEFERQRSGMDGKLDELRNLIRDGYEKLNDKILPPAEIPDIEGLKSSIGTNIKDSELVVSDKISGLLENITTRMIAQEKEIRDLIGKLELQASAPGSDQSPVIDETQIMELREKLRQVEVSRDKAMVNLRDKSNMYDLLKTDCETNVNKLEEQNRLMGQIEDMLREYTDSIPGFSEMNLDAKIDEVLKFVSKDCESTRPQRIVTSGNLSELLGMLTLTGEQENRLKEIKKEETDKLMKISRELYDSYEKIRTTLHNSIYLHQLRNEILTNFPENELSNLSSRASVNERSSEVGSLTIVDAFSPVREPSRDPKLLGMVLASTIYRIFRLDDTISLLNLVDNRGPNPAITQSLRQICERYGKRIESGNMIYDLDDMFMVQISLIKDIRKYVLDTQRSGMDLAYGLDARYVLLDVFVRAYSESVYGLVTLSDRFRVSEGLTETKASPTIISYLRIRADAPEYVIDPRYYLKVDGNRKKLLMGHEPYVESSMAMKKYDKEPYQFDVYGPFNRVFVPEDNNTYMSENVPEILEVLEAGKNLCIIALGPSGSGKTSTLLYFRGSKSVSAEYGVIPQALGLLSTKFSEAKVKAYEFRNNYEKKSDSEPYWKTHEVFDREVTFMRRGESWMSDGSETTGKLLNYDVRPDNPVCESSSPFNRPLETFKFGKLDISEFMSKLIDIRLNCGTPNNPVSSRTHLFISVKFANGPSLIIADLAGREKVFDCNSESVLQTIALNPLYPKLNILFSSPITSNPVKFEQETVLGRSTNKFSPLEPMNFKKMSTALDVFTSDDLQETAEGGESISIKSLIDASNLDQYFKTPYLGYDQKNAASSYVFEANQEGITKNIYQRFYRVMEVIFSHILTKGYPMEIESRISNLVNQSKVVQERMERLPDEDIRQRVYQIMSYFSNSVSNIATQSNVSVMSQTKRISLKTGVPENDINKALKYMVPMLELILVLKYLDDVLRSSAGRVCDIRSLESGFINRSLDEFTTLVSSVSNANASYGPLVHEQCLPVSCAFSGLDCLIPSKNLPGGIQSSAIKTMLDETIGQELSPDNITFATFLVINYTPRPKDEKSFRPLFDAAEILLKPVTEAFDNAVNQPYIMQPRVSNQESIISLWSRFLKVYDSELELRMEFKARKEYMGVNQSKTLTETFRNKAYESSVENWMTLRDISQRMITVVESYRGVDHMKLREEFNTLTKIRDLIKDCRVRNQDTIPGSLIMLDDMVKRYLQPLTCSAVSETTVLDNVSDKWISL